MNNCKVVLAKAHAGQLADEDVVREMDSVQNYIRKMEYDPEADEIYGVFLRGEYRDFEKRMNAALVFINNLNRPICELHGVLRFAAADEKVQFARTVIDFDRDFLGSVGVEEALLVHLNIPVKGLRENKTFSARELQYVLDDVRVTCEEDCDEK